MDELYADVQRFPYNLDAHNQLLNVLRLNKSTEYKELYQARLNKFKYFMVTEDEIADTVEDLMAIKNPDDKVSLLDEFYCFVVKECPATYFWCRYIDFCQQFKLSEEVQTILIKALADTVYDFKGSKIIWDKTIGFALETLGNTQDEEDLIRVWKLMLKRLSYPHETLSESFESTSAFVSKFFPDEYDQFMNTALQVYSKLSQDQRYFETHEIKIASDPKNCENWKAYIEDVGKYSFDLSQTTAIFYRFLVETGDTDTDDDWMSVWIKYIYCLYSKPDNEQLLKDVLPKFVRAYPNSCIPYAECIRNMQIFDDNYMYQDLRTRIEYCHLRQNNSYDDWKVLALSILSYENSIHSPQLDSVIQDYFTFAVDHNRDIFHSVERLSISIYESKDHIDKAIKLVDLLISKFPDQSELWLFAFEYYKKHGFPYSEINRLFDKAIEFSDKMDWPERVIQEQLIYELVCGTRVSYQKALLKADETMNKIMISRMDSEEDQESEEPEFTNSLNGKAQHKRRASDYEVSNKKQKVEETRNREELSVKVTNLTSSSTEAKLKDFFADCGQINDIIIFLNHQTYEAIIEFNSMQAVLAALTKSHKKVEDTEITVKRLLNSIIWVTNFPPSYTEADVNQLFKDVGTIVGIRFPHQNLNKTRRFCYVEFADPESVNVAVSLFNGTSIVDKLDGKLYQLVVKVSDTSQQKKKSPIFKREVYISNVDFSVSEEEIRQIFEPCGSIERVVLPLNADMRAKGNKNGGFGFVVFNSETSVAEALSKNGALVKGRPINVSPSKKKIENSSKPDGLLDEFEANRSVVLFNIDSSTIEQQVQLFLKESVDIECTRLKLIPEFEAVIVQFKSVADSGKAALKLETLQFKGRQLRVGSKSDLKPKTTHMVPATVRRKR